LVPLSAEAIERAIALNGVAIEFNQAAFRWGRRTAVDPELVQARAIPPAAAPPSHRLSDTLDEVISRRVAFLTKYQDAAYAARYAARVGRVREAEAACLPGETELTQSVARSLFKLMAYKDEYEVARLYADTDFLQRIADRLEGPYKLYFHLAPPLLGERDPETGHLRKRSFGPWMLPVFRVLAGLRRVRGTPFDIFGRSEERRLERRLIGQYEALVDEILTCLSPANHHIAVELSSLPLEIRGFGHVKEANLAHVKAQQEVLLVRFRTAQLHAAAAE
jgi:indolepyruvate ferredoxin oxidoreductase